MAYNPLKSTLHQLHLYIQVAMGWKCSHLYQFKIGNSRYQCIFPDQEKDDEEGDPTLDNTQYKLKDFNFIPGRRFSYEYDFGDSWMHDIHVKAVTPVKRTVIDLPCYTSGAIPCPPENIGGIDAYNMLVQFRFFKTPTGLPEMKEYFKDFDIYTVDALRSFGFDSWAKKIGRITYG